jgi:hypothetical protein
MNCAAESVTQPRRDSQVLQATSSGDSGTARVLRGEPWLVAAILFVALVVTHWWCLRQPPYVEQAVGLWTEASYLIDSGFDYRKLFYDELHVEVGGPRTYACSLLPTLLAGLMLATGSMSATILISHLVSLACAAAVGGMLYCWLQPRVGRLRASLLLVAVATLPLVAVQLEMVGLDMPMAAASIPFFVLVDRRRWSWAAISTWLAFAMKPSAFLLPFALTTYLVALFVGGWLARRKPLDWKLLWGAFTSVLCFVGQFAMMWAADNLNGRVRMLEDVRLWLRSSPEVFVLLLGAVAATLWLLLRRSAGKTSDVQAAGLIERLFDWLAAEPLFAVAWLVVGGTMAASAATYYESRHLLLVAPLVALIVGRVLAEAPGVAWQVFGLLVIVMLQLGNRYGAWYPELPLRDARGWGVPERSLEYRQDHLSNVDAVRRLEFDHAGESLLVCEHFTHFVSLPLLGYATHALTGPRPYVFGADDTNLWQLFDDQPAEVVVLYLEPQMGALPFPAYAIPLPGPEDELVDDDHLRPARLIYRKRFASDLPPADRLRQYVDFLYSQATELDAVGRLIVVGNLPTARRLAALENHWNLDDPRLTAELLARLTRLAEQLAPPTIPETGADGDQLRQQYLHEKLVEIIARRRKELLAGDPLKPLAWDQRSVSSTLAQRWLYIPGSARPSQK